MVENLKKEEFLKIDKLLQRTNAIDGKIDWIIRGQSYGKPIKELLTEFLKKNKHTAKVYLEIDGKKNTSQIAKILKISPSAVSQHIDKLNLHGLIQPSDKYGIHKKTEIEKILRIDQIIKKEVLK
jgi:DNA-binding MarR family transcriptional regulator